MIYKDDLDSNKIDYLKSLISSISTITNKIVERINSFRKECTLFDQEFLMYNYVKYIKILGLRLCMSNGNKRNTITNANKAW